MQILSNRVHGTCVALGANAVLIRGPSGSGKSDLALRFVMQMPASAAPSGERRLVADDQVELTRDGQHIVATAPAPLRDKLEVRGLGIIPIVGAGPCQLVAVVDLVGPEDVERMPNLHTHVDVLGLQRPSLKLYPHEAAAPLKLALFVDFVAQSGQ